MPVAEIMEQDFPRGGGRGGPGSGSSTHVVEHGGGEIKKKKRRSQQRLIDSLGDAHTKDDLLVEKEGKDDDSDEELLDNKSDNLFKTVKPKPSKKIRDRARAAAAKEKAAKEEEDEGELVVEPLTYDTIQVGLLCLGIVHEIREHEVVVSLPGRTVGAIPLTAVSTPYTNLLNKIESGAAEISDLKPLSELFTIGQVLVVRVMHIKEQEHATTGSIRRTVILSSNPSDIHSNYNATLIQEGMQFTSAIQSIEDHGLVMDIGVRGVRSFLPRNRLPARSYAEAAVGRLLQCKVILSKVQRLLCNVTLQEIPASGRPNPYVIEDESLNAALLLPGMSLDAHVMQVHKTGLKIYFLELMGTVHADHTGAPWQLPFELEKYSNVQATLLYVQPTVGALPSLTLRRDLCPGRLLPTPRATGAAYPRGVSYPVTIERFEKRGIIVKFENGAKGIVSTRRCFAHFDKRARDTSAAAIRTAFPTGSKHLCRVLEHSELDDVFVGSFAHANAPETPQQQQQGQQGVQKGSTPSLRAGGVLKCTVVEWKKSGALVRLVAGASNRSMGFIPNLHFDKYDEVKTRKRHHPEGGQLKAKVWKLEKDKVLLTARKKLVQAEESLIPAQVGDINVGSVFRGMVFKSAPRGLHISIVGGIIGFVPASLLAVPGQYVERRYPPGEIVCVKAIEVEPQRPTLIFNVLEEGMDEPVSAVPELPLPVKVEEENEDESHDQETSEAKQTATVKSTKKATKLTKRQRKKAKAQEDAHAQEVKDIDAMEVEIKEEPEDAAATEVRPLKRTVAELRPTTSSSFWDADEVDEKPNVHGDGVITAGEEGTDPAPPTKKSKKQRAAEREAEIRRQEAALADPTRAPTSVEDYERLVLASPASSMVWIKYISMHLEAGNLPEARAIGERALTTIPCTEEAERFNVWTALLNLENEHGTPDTLKTRFTAALRNCDELATYKQLAQIYMASKRNDEARSLLRTMVKRFPAHVPIWSMAAQHLYRTQQFDEARTLYTRAVAALPARNHVEIISKFAQLELAFGDFEQGRGMYEKLVGTYGKRVDIWLVYINQMIKQKDYEGARALFERVTSGGTVQPKKMQAVYKRWLEFEREHGTLESVAAVEENCASYYKERLGLSIMGDGDDNEVTNL